MSRRLLLASAALALFSSLPVLAYWRWTRSPQWSLRKIVAAIESRDVNTFEYYVDIETLARRLLDDLVVIAASERTSAADSTAQTIASGLIQLVKPTVVASFRDSVLRALEEGNRNEILSFTGNVGDEEARLKEALVRFAPEPLRYTGPGDEHIEGTVARIGVKLMSRKYERELRLELKFRHMGNYWRLVEFANVHDWWRGINALEYARTRKRLADTLSFSAVQQATFDDHIR